MVTMAAAAVAPVLGVAAMRISPTAVVVVATTGMVSRNMI